MATKKKTTEKICESLIELLEATPRLDDITVTALCERAAINRATFYYHYDSVEAVFTDLESHMESEFMLFLSSTAMTADNKPEKSFYVMFFEFVARNASLCRIILNSPLRGANSFMARAIESGKYKVIGIMSKIYPNCPTAKINHYYIFVVHGFMGILEYWLNSGMHESVEEIAEIAETISYSGVKYLEPKQK